MGKNWKKNQKKRTQGNNERNWVSYVPENETFEQYYKDQGILPEDEWDTFMSYLRKPLPTTFRLTASRRIAPLLQEQIKQSFVPYLTGVELEGKTVPPPQPLPWYPKEWAWQIDIDKRDIRKNERFKKLHKFLVLEMEAGNLSRQEAVSMIPPLMLDVKPHHYVLDMCAAPGSKTAQILETLAGDEEQHAQIAQGLLIANDSESKRCHMLVHQSLRRIPYTSMMVTHHDASLLPALRIKSGSSYDSLTFDRILADVPCSGDGTLRKNPSIWKEWNIRNANYLHELQLRIATRAVHLLRPGGRLVYSTCSLNPIENEAVVSTILNRFPEMQLADVSETLPALTRRPGLLTWKVMKKDGSLAQESDIEDDRSITATLWPNGNETANHLERCVRIYPQLQNTGGFFVAVLEKKADAPLRYGKVSHKRPGDNDNEQDGDVTKRTKPDVEVKDKDVEVKDKDLEAEGSATGDQADPAPVDLDTKTPADAPRAASEDTSSSSSKFKEAPFTYLPEDHHAIKHIESFFGLSSAFRKDCLLVRHAEPVAIKSLHYTSPVVKAIVQANSHDRMRCLSCGVKGFVRDNRSGASTEAVDNDFCRWRVSYDGLDAVLPFISENRIVRGTPADLESLVTHYHAPVEQVSFKDRLETMSCGCVILEVDTTFSDVETVTQRLHLPLWKAVKLVSLMVDRNDKNALSVRLYGEEKNDDLFDSSAKQKQQKREAEMAQPENTQQEDTQPENTEASEN